MCAGRAVWPEQVWASLQDCEIASAHHCYTVKGDYWDFGGKDKSFHEDKSYTNNMFQWSHLNIHSDLHLS